MGLNDRLLIVSGSQSAQISAAQLYLSDISTPRTIITFSGWAVSLWVTA